MNLETVIQEQLNWANDTYCSLVMFLPPENEVWGKVIFSVACQEFCPQGGGLPHCMLGYPPRTRGRPPEQPPWEQIAPRSRHPPPRADTTPLGSRLPPPAVHVGRYGEQAGGTHPTGMQSCSMLSMQSYLICFRTLKSTRMKCLFFFTCLS